MQHLINVALKSSRAIIEAKGQHVVLVVTIARVKSC
jgi:hypothetical protein